MAAPLPYKVALTTTSPSVTSLDNKEKDNNVKVDVEAVVATAPAPSGWDDIPEGGYGWVVLFSCGMLTLLYVGTAYSWGVMQAGLVAAHLSDPSTLAWVGSIAAAMISLLAIANAKLIRMFGARALGIAGVVLLGGGELLSGFATHNVGALFVTAGLVMGIGIAFCFTVATTLPSQYFKAKRGLANGIVCAAGGLGGAAISLSYNALVKNVGPEWTFRAMGLATLALGVPSAAFIRERVAPGTRAFVEWSLLRDFRFLCLFFAGAIGTFPLLVPPFFLPLYATQIGLTPTVGAILVASFNLSSAVGRLAFGRLCDKIGPLNSLLCSLIVSTLSMLAIWPVSTSLAPLIVFVILNGGATGGFFAVIPTVVGAVFGSPLVVVGMGMLVTGWAGGYMMGAPIAGYLLDAFGGAQNGLHAYRPAIYFSGGLMAVSVALVAAVRFRAARAILAKA